MKRFILLFISCVCFSSVYAQTYYSIGDYYNCNGVEGVVFEVSDNGTHGKVVSLYDFNNVSWVDSSVSNAVIQSSPNDGKANTDKVMKRSDSYLFYAFARCRSLGDSWYLPAKFELAKLYARREVINRALEYNGGEPLDGWYWSSSESDAYPNDYAYGYIIWRNLSSDGGEFNNSKRDSDPHHKVRAIAKF